MDSSWIVLIPPLLVIFLATISRKMVPSLLLGILSAALIVSDGEPLAALKLAGQRIFSVSELGLLRSFDCLSTGSYIFICFFLLFLGIIIELIIASGGAFAYAQEIKKRVSSARALEGALLFMTHLFFIDDYFNSLTVGSVMRPLTDQFKIPRIKLGLIINTVAAPLALIVPISSWVADVVMQLRQAGVSALPTNGIAPSCAPLCANKLSSCLIAIEPFSLFLLVIPCIFYSFIQIGSLWFLVLNNLSFGILAEHQKIAEQTANLFGGKSPVIERRSGTQRNPGQSRLRDFILPLGLLLGFIAGGIMLWGTGKMALVLALSAAGSTAVSMIYFLVSGTFSAKALGKLSYEGILATLPSVKVLILIWTMSSFLRYDLHTGNYLAALLIGKISLQYLPVLFFLVGSLISTLMGSAWGAIGILVSIALPMFASYYEALLPLSVAQAPLMLPLIGALLSGALVANHCSPLADILLMSATSSGSYHIDLIKAQISFCFSGIIVTASMFLLAGFLITSCGYLVTTAICLLLGLGLNCAWLYKRSF